MIEISRIKSCATCEMCKTDYLGMVEDDFGQIRLAKIGEPVCTLAHDVYGAKYVRLMSDTNGLCEMFTERIDNGEDAR